MDLNSLKVGSLVTRSFSCPTMSPTMQEAGGGREAGGGNDASSHSRRNGMRLDLSTWKLSGMSAQEFSGGDDVQHTGQDSQGLWMLGAGMDAEEPDAEEPALTWPFGEAKDAGVSASSRGTLGCAAGELDRIFLGMEDVALARQRLVALAAGSKESMIVSPQFNTGVGGADSVAQNFSRLFSTGNQQSPSSALSHAVLAAHNSPRSSVVSHLSLASTVLREDTCDSLESFDGGVEGQCVETVCSDASGGGSELVGVHGRPTRLQLLGGGLQLLNVESLPLINESLNETATPSAPTPAADADALLGAVGWGPAGVLRESGARFLGGSARMCGKRGRSDITSPPLLKPSLQTHGWVFAIRHAEGSAGSGCVGGL